MHQSWPRRPCPWNTCPSRVVMPTLWSWMLMKLTPNMYTSRIGPISAQMLALRTSPPWASSASASASPQGTNPDQYLLFSPIIPKISFTLFVHFYNFFLFLFFGVNNVLYSTRLASLIIFHLNFFNSSSHCL